MVFFQRLFPLDALNMGIVNELEDPFFGEDDEVHELIRECGHRMYVTPNLRAWLQHCDDWIEALPAYATYEIIPGEGGSYKVRAFVQRGIMEDMYRRHAPDWALNIEEVMDLEHVALAREVVAAQMKLVGEAEALATKSDPGPGGWDKALEEAIRELLKQKAQPADIAAVAAVVAQTYDNLCEDVAARRQEGDLSRVDALREVLENAVSDGNLLAAARRECAEEVALADLPLHPRQPGPFDLDVHAIPAYRDCPGHEHFDVRFLFRAPSLEFGVGEEVAGARWVGLDEVEADPASDASVLRAVRKVRRYL